MGVRSNEINDMASSARRIRQVGLTRLKTDKSFVKGIEVDSDDLAIVRTIAAMARTLSLSVVAKGVQTEAQHALLVDAGVGVV